MYQGCGGCKLLHRLFYFDTSVVFGFPDMVEGDLELGMTLYTVCISYFKVNFYLQP